MKVIIQNFRHYQGPARAFTFPAGQVSHLAGGSGQGKTTILLAVAWAFYGGLRGNALKPMPSEVAALTARANNPKRRVAAPPRHAPSAHAINAAATAAVRSFGCGESATAVIVELPELGAIVKRKAAATAAVEVAFIDLSAEPLRGDAATAWIESAFGTRNLWLSSSYIPQGGRNPLLSLTNAEKFSLLYELTFGSVLPATDLASTEVTSEALAQASASETSPAPFVRAVTVATNAAKNAAREAGARAAAARDTLDDVLARFEPIAAASGIETARSVEEIDAFIAESTRFIEITTRDLASSIAAENKRQSMEMLRGGIVTRADVLRKKLAAAQLALDEARESHGGETSYADAVKSRETLAAQAKAHAANKAKVEAALHREADAREALARAEAKVSEYGERDVQAGNREDIENMERLLVIHTRMSSSTPHPVAPSSEKTLIKHGEAITELWNALAHHSVPKPKRVLESGLKLMADRAELFEEDDDVVRGFARIALCYSERADSARRTMERARRVCYRKCCRALELLSNSSEGAEELALPEELEGALQIENALTRDAVLRGQIDGLMCECARCGSEVNIGSDKAVPIIDIQGLGRLKLRPGVTSQQARGLVSSLIATTRTLNSFWTEGLSGESEATINAEALVNGVWGDGLPFADWNPVDALLLSEDLFGRPVGPAVSRSGDFASIVKAFETPEALAAARDSFAQLEKLRKALPAASRDLPIDELEKVLVARRAKQQAAEVAEKMLIIASADTERAREVLLAAEHTVATVENELQCGLSANPTEEEFARAEEAIARAMEHERHLAVHKSVVNNAEDELSAESANLRDIDRSLASIGEVTIGALLREQAGAEIERRRVLIAAAHREREVVCARSEIALAKKRYATAVKREEDTAARLASGSEAVRLVAAAATTAITEVVNATALAANTILADIFPHDTPMTVSLELSQKGGSVTTAAAGNTVSLIVSYRGATYEGAGLLSGGETDRLSFALTVALATAAQSPIMLLDECFSSLDEDTQDLCFSALRKYLPGKTTVNVCHSSIGGLHDDSVVAGLL